MQVETRYVLAHGDLSSGKVCFWCVVSGNPKVILWKQTSHMDGKATCWSTQALADSRSGAPNHVDEGIVQVGALGPAELP